MAMIEEVTCIGCGKKIWADPSDPNQECTSCQKQSGHYVKTWGEMTLEEKVEDLHRRVSQLGMTF